MNEQAGGTGSVAAFRGVSKRFPEGPRPVTAIDNLTCAIGRGRITGLVGPDGAGKTTLMRLLAGLLVPDDGEMRVLGESVGRGHGPNRQQIGYMPQKFGLYDELSVIENLRLYADLHAVPAGRRAEAYDKLLGFSGLGPFVGRRAGKLSGGMKQKLALACSLVSRPRLLLLDEPSVGVDPVSRRELWRIVRGLVSEGVTVVWSTAYMDEAERCDEVLLLGEGKLLGAGRPDGFMAALVGRIWSVATTSQDRRHIQALAGQIPGVIDSLIQGGRLRLLMDGPRAGGVAIPELGKARQATPRFEDAYVDIVLRDNPAAAHDEVIESDGEGLVAAPRRREGPIIEVNEITRYFGAFHAVDGVSFTVASGEIYGLLGPNGAGKSTIFKMLCGLLKPSGGGAMVAAADVRNAPRLVRRRIGYMSQKFSLYGDLTVEQNLKFYGGAYGLRGKRNSHRVGQIMTEFGLRPFRAMPAENLPLGYKQRLALGAALIHQPDILFLDEPTSGVDPLSRRAFWRRINALAARGVTVLITSHFMDEAEYCDRLGIVYRGRMIAEGTPPAIIADAVGDQPAASLEDAFVALIERFEQDNPL